MEFSTSGLRSSPGMGTGMAESAAEILHLRPFWEQEYTNGLTNKQFADWARDPQILAKYQNAPKIMPGQNQPTGKVDYQLPVGAQLPQQVTSEDPQLVLMRYLQQRGQQ